VVPTRLTGGETIPETDKLSAEGCIGADAEDVDGEEEGKGPERKVVSVNSQTLFPVIARSCIVALLLCTGACGTRSVTESSNLPFTVLDHDDISIAGKTRMVYRVRLDTTDRPTEEAMRSTATAIWKEGNTSWDEFTVFMRLPESVYENEEWAKTVFPYGRAEFTRAGLQTLDVNRDALLYTRWQEKPVNKVAEPVPYRLDMTASLIGPRQLAVDVATDLPNGTNLLVNVQRSYWQRTTDTDIEYAGDIFIKDIPVRDGKIHAEVDIGDSAWMKARNAKKEHFTKLGIWDEVGKVSPDVEVSVLYSSMRDQPQDVRHALGAFGQPDKAGSGPAKTIRVEKIVTIPYKP
jgi:hypothetical protein